MEMYFNRSLSSHAAVRAKKKKFGLQNPYYYVYQVIYIKINFSD